LSQQQADERADEQRGGDGDGREQHRVPDRGPEEVVTEDLAVVVEADVLRGFAAQLAQADLLERHLADLDDRPDEQHADGHERGQDQQVRPEA
jgi:hypothetical protein